MAAFVLVHGTGGGGWYWQFLVPLLRAAGYDVYTPTLTGLGSSSHLLHELNRISLDTHVKDVANLLFYEDLSEVVLVGHSYGGMVITGVAAKEPHRLAQLVYFDAYLPLEGENEIVLWPDDQKEKYRADLASGIKFRPPIASSMLEITDPKMSDWVQERLTPHPYSTYEDPPASGTPESASIPRTYIHCTLGPLSSWMEPFAARARKLGWSVYIMAEGHAVMITHPNKLAEILLQIANK
ncbi:MAG TPA: alpha/beta fold hydrolase [Nitrososphaera sp.]|nr:alpha/beta fold hydrolase [Nitrososphaera sp.]